MIAITCSTSSHTFFGRDDSRQNSHNQRTNLPLHLPPLSALIWFKNLQKPFKGRWCRKEKNCLHFFMNKSFSQKASLIDLLVWWQNGSGENFLIQHLIATLTLETHHPVRCCTDTCPAAEVFLICSVKRAAGSTWPALFFHLPCWGRQSQSKRRFAQL